MINLDVLMEKTIDFTLKGKLIRVQQPTLKMIKKFAAIEKDADIDKQIEVITEILNNNSSNIKLEKSDIEELNQPALMAILEAITNNIKEADNNPN
ncbi:hypothetical protein [Clostridium cylindrosporum]|uniref:Uncharacterized protein n=1 Tax=Clostridium cylindrosporum DSM 605 TaxID=1121307 RepID=A0A0J8D6V8_CLOCY|nr:hypothetical protein [Clostridium cylindrosporum]KMT21597.1 hypothetical protein CLCY_2c03590 [Clostridium cylindrosporum DSM 605]